MIRKLRMERGWSQEHLAGVSGLSVRTIQRVENGQKAGLETLNSLAVAFEMEVADLSPQPHFEEDGDTPYSTEKTTEDFRAMKDFIGHLFFFLICFCFSLAINLMTNPDHLWVWWPALCWGVILAIQALNLFEAQFLNKFLEKRQAQKS